MSKEKQIQIPESLYTLMVNYIIDKNYQTMDNFNIIKQGINDKIDRQIASEYYTQYKTGLTAEIREQARQAYLDKKGISHKFRW